MTSKPFLGRTALITGGDSGLGAACAIALAQAGADIAILCHRLDEDSAKVIAAVESEGSRIVAIGCDVGVEDDVERAFAQTVDVLAVPDILVNSAGINMSGVQIVDMEAAQWERTIRADLTGTFLTSRRFVRGLRRLGRPGSIVNITSIHAFAMRAGGADYTSAKGGQTNLTQTLALETAGLGITVNAIAPGMFLTPMNARAVSDEAHRAELERQIPMGRAGRPEEVGRLAVYLCSPEATYITGATITIDGGLSLLMGQGA
jgi:glucose 1-dehydrogenase